LTSTYSPLTSTYSVSKVLRTVRKEEKLVKVFCNYCFKTCMRRSYLTVTPVCEICNDICMTTPIGRRVVKKLIKKSIRKTIRKAIRKSIVRDDLSIFESPVYSHSSLYNNKLVKSLSKAVKYNKLSKYSKYSKYNYLF